MEKILITGTAGFIAYHTTLKFLSEGYEVVGLDNINDYYDINLKYGRLAESGVTEDSASNYSLQVASSMLQVIRAENTQAATCNLQPATFKTMQESSLFEYGTLYQSNTYKNYRFIRLALEDYESLKELFEKEKFDKVVHLAAQAGVRYSLTNPFTYADCNLNGHLNIMEACRHHKVKHLVYASSSSVYGSNTKMPLSTSDNVDHPISLYAATKKANELMSYTYSHLYGLPTTGLRFFTVYGPWGRPDMALFLFTKAMLEDKPIDVYNHGEMWRDFTYVEDIVEGVYRVTFDSKAMTSKISDTKFQIPNSGPAQNSKFKTQNSIADPSTSAPFKVYNIGNSSPVKLLDFIKAIEDKLGVKAKMNMMDMQPGDVPKTWADTTDLEADVGYKPDTSVEVGVGRFVEWYREYYCS
ncbi:MAG: NAD-dependent epimerase [Bacteroidales bacterium]|nr:NAD-dependent epimerase [Bacteroidales bacterium]MCF8345548.1 NAD-dependent epimerase [Bacteroidales bacterium]MCF8351045.1 NAD-dependent epimerase [Bacteroidales bacterium]MCF8375889.1 NAD-dependent epimerase [Bacteroidales bacterium]MCF8402009.1 NAD-dependent epimerase [Bacteroidales bacterium]